ncbi:hypothetical protein [Winogradskyella sp.]|uniref:hypothetical protein n=1 Tax=Winogradskyella sp. TaxID=1883156 RepID=UPI00262BB7E6|nr:hypothetical protein [Winogradskyella sp.]
MKTITLTLITFLISLSSFAQADVQNFRVTSAINQTFTSSNGQRFDYEFDISGNYGYNEIKLWAYAESINPNNLIGLIRWNREGDDNLNFSSYTTAPKWVNIAHVWDGRSFSTNPLETFFLVVEYQGTSVTLSYTIPDSDSDGDGVFDSQDDCPNEAGPASNNGCPDDFDLRISDFRIFQKNSFSSGNPSVVLDYPTANFEIKHTGDYSFAPKIRLDGSGSGNREYNIKIVAYRYTGNYYPNVSTSSNFTELINGDVFIGIGDETEPVSDFDDGFGPVVFTQGSGTSTTLNGELQVSAGTTYALSVIVEPLDFSDSNTSNNQINVQFLFNNVEANSAPGGGGGPIKYPIIIIGLDDFSKSTVNNEEEYQKALKSIPKGFYVIHDKDGKQQSKIIKQ